MEGHNHPRISIKNTKGLEVKACFMPNLGAWVLFAEFQGEERAIGIDGMDMVFLKREDAKHFAEERGLKIIGWEVDEGI